MASAEASLPGEEVVASVVGAGVLLPDGEVGGVDDVVKIEIAGEVRPAGKTRRGSDVDVEMVLVAAARVVVQGDAGAGGLNAVVDVLIRRDEANDAAAGGGVDEGDGVLDDVGLVDAGDAVAPVVGGAIRGEVDIGADAMGGFLWGVATVERLGS